MKKRTGFVSNSSSSSFIIQWQCHLAEEDLDPWDMCEEGSKLDKTVATLLDYFDNPDTLKEIVAKTQEMSSRNNRYITTFFTHMKNSVEDFGNSAIMFNMALTVEEIESGKSRFEILHKTIEDGGW